MEMLCRMFRTNASFNVEQVGGRCGWRSVQPLWWRSRQHLTASAITNPSVKFQAREPKMLRGYNASRDRGPLKDESLGMRLVKDALSIGSSESL